MMKDDLEKYLLKYDDNFKWEGYTPQTTIREAKTFGKWDVSLEGDLIYDNGRYPIYSDQVASENNWIAHLFEKGWIDWNDFIPAYFQALKNLGIQKKEMLIYYPGPPKQKTK